jgi:hypothetical protein
MSTATDIGNQLRYALDILSWCREAIHFEPDPWQERVLVCDDPQVILNISRQAGKSTVTALLAAHMSIYQPNSLTLLISKGQRQSAELHQKCRQTLVNLGQKLNRDNQLSTQLPNGSRILSLPSDPSTIRGFSPDLVVFDEAAFCSDQVYNAMRPMLSVSRGRLFLISTPMAVAGYFLMNGRLVEMHGTARWLPQMIVRAYPQSFLLLRSDGAVCGSTRNIYASLKMGQARYSRMI